MERGKEPIGWMGIYMTAGPVDRHQRKQSIYYKQELSAHPLFLPLRLTHVRRSDNMSLAMSTCTNFFLFPPWHRTKSICIQLDPLERTL